MCSARPEEGKNHLNTGFYKRFAFSSEKKDFACRESGIKTHPTNHALYICYTIAATDGLEKYWHQEK
jgi:hypothetical protein